MGPDIKRAVSSAEENILLLYTVVKLPNSLAHIKYRMGTKLYLVGLMEL